MDSVQNIEVVPVVVMMFEGLFLGRFFVVIYFGYLLAVICD